MNIDPEQFLNLTIRGANVTKRTPVPRGEYPAIIKSAVPRSVVSNGEDRTLADVYFAIDDPAATEATGIPHPTVKKSYWLDIGPDGLLETGKNKNVELGRLRMALGQNNENEDWNFNMLIGQACFVTVEHGKDDYANVDKVGKTAADLGKSW